MHPGDTEDPQDAAQSAEGAWNAAYARALRRHLDAPDEGTRAAAYDLGRKSVALGLGQVALVAAHHDVLRAATLTASQLSCAGEFLAEAVAPYEMLQRGFRDTIRHQTTLNRELEHRADALAQANETIDRLHRERSVFISRASRALASSLDFEQVARTVVALAVPALSDWAAVEVNKGEERWRVAELGAAGGDPLRQVELAVGPRPVAELLLREARSEGAAEREALIAEFAERAALALENARLFTEATRAVELRNEFLSIASHELNTPLTPLQLSLESVKPALVGPGMDRELRAVDRAIRQIRRLKFLVRDMLDGSRIQTGRLELNLKTVDLRETVQETILSFAKDPRGAPLRVALPEAPLWVHADAFRMEQVVLNLVDNAMKYGPRGEEIRVTAAVEAGCAVVSVEDAGIGIPVDQREQVFEAFFRARNAPTHHYGGLGLGLHISAEIVKRHGGRIWVAEARGGGAHFSFSLPLAPAPAEGG